jgi:hypothetical protein
MPNNLTEQQKKQASLYLNNAMSISSKRKFEKELRSNLTLQAYLDELTHMLETTREFSTLSPSDELLQGSRNLLRHEIQAIENSQITESWFNVVFDKIRSGITSIIKVRQPVWAIATYIVIGVIAGRLLLGPSGDRPLDLNGNGNLDMDKVISSGLLDDVQIDKLPLAPSSVKFVSNIDDRFNVTGDVNDQDIKKILYYMLLNDEDKNKRLEAGRLINRIAPNEETQMVLISSVISEQDSQVKLQSIRTLNNYQTTDELTDACKRILLDERDPKIRLEALTILENKKSSDLIPLLEVVIKMDDDSSVRDKADKLLDELQKPTAIENTEVAR